MYQKKINVIQNFPKNLAITAIFFKHTGKIPVLDILYTQLCYKPIILNWRSLLCKYKINKSYGHSWKWTPYFISRNSNMYIDNGLKINKNAKFWFFSDQRLSVFINSYKSKIVLMHQMLKYVFLAGWNIFKPTKEIN